MWCEEFWKKDEYKMHSEWDNEMKATEHTSQKSGAVGYAIWNLTWENLPVTDSMKKKVEKKKILLFTSVWEW